MMNVLEHFEKSFRPSSLIFSFRITAGYYFLIHYVFDMLYQQEIAENIHLT